MEVHPAAELFPLMSDQELEGLAEDIRENGLRQPVTLDGEGRLLDGRNRLAACKLAKVEPDFTTANGDDPIALVVSLNVKRRNLSAGQRAIAAAEAAALSVSKLTREARLALAKQFETSDGYVSQARALVERDRPAADEVKAGVLTLTEAYDGLRTREREFTQRKDERERLHQRPDLEELVEAGKLSLGDALSIIDREAREAADARQRYRRYLTDAVAFLDWPGGPDGSIAAAADAAAEDKELTVERFRAAAERCAAIAAELEKRSKK